MDSAQFTNNGGEIKRLFGIIVSPDYTCPGTRSSLGVPPNRTRHAGPSLQLEYVGLFCLFYFLPSLLFFLLLLFTDG